MPPSKAIGIVLKTLAYRETSAILHWYTREMGLVQGIAKGIRRRGKEQTIVERGFLVEALVYGRGSQTLHTLGGLAVVEFFPGIREDLAKSAVRDTALETLLFTLHDSEENRELFEFLMSFLSRLDGAAPARGFPFALWRFFCDFAAIEGFGLNLVTCLQCNGSLGGAIGGRLKTDTGGVICTRCETPRGSAALLPGPVIDFINCQSDVPSPAVKNLDREALKRITRLFAAYCRYHFDSRHDYRSLDFVDEMIDGMEDA
jgi:DNA repair protein RecO